MLSSHPETVARRARLAAQRARERVSVPPAEPKDDLSKKERAELEHLRERFRAQEETAGRRINTRSVPIGEHEPGSPGLPMTIWSDWHWGETVRKEDMGGRNEFNYEIACERVDRLVNRTIAILMGYAGSNPVYKGIYVCLGGDMISGGIHDELVETNWAPAVGQAFQVQEVLAGALEAMADRFGEVYVPCVVGNHGRNAKRPRAKLAIHENSEYWLYKSLEKHFANDPRFHFTVATSSDVDFSVYGHRFRLTHGDTLGVKGGDGQIGALGPIVRGILKTNASDREIGLEFDTCIMGHWHSYQPRGSLIRGIVNGTLKGHDEYALRFLRASYNRPSQALWLVSPKHGIAAQWEVFCDEQRGK